MARVSTEMDRRSRRMRREVPKTTKGDTGLRIHIVFGYQRYASRSADVHAIVALGDMFWSEGDAYPSFDSAVQKCFIPVRAFVPHASLFAEVFTAGVCATLISSITVSCALATFPDSKGALALLSSLAMSILTAYDIRIPHGDKRRGYILSAILMLVTYSTLQIFLVNVCKNEITSAFSQTESSVEIWDMIKSYKRRPREVGFVVTASFFTQHPNSIRIFFWTTLKNRAPYCDLGDDSLLRRFYIPLATVSKKLRFARFDFDFGPLRRTKAIETIRRFGLITLRSSYLSHSNLDHRVLKVLDTWARRSGKDISWDFCR